MLRRWAAFTRFLIDGRVCLSNNAAERTLRCVPLGRKSWLFCSSDGGGQRAAVAYSLIQTCRLNDVDPRPGSLTSWPVSPTIPSAASTSSCRGTGGALGSLWQPDGPRQLGPFRPNHRPRRSGSRQNRRRNRGPCARHGSRRRPGLGLQPGTRKRHYGLHHASHREPGNTHIRPGDRQKFASMRSSPYGYQEGTGITASPIAGPPQPDFHDDRSPRIRNRRRIRIGLHLDLRKAVASLLELPPPAIDLTRSNIGKTGNLSNVRPRR